MPNIKYTERKARQPKKTSQQLQDKVRCPVCKKEMSRKTSMRLHLGAVHGQDKAGHALPESVKLHYATEAAKQKLQREKRSMKRPKTPAVVYSTSSSSATSPERPWRPSCAPPPPAAEGRPPSVDPMEQVRAELAISDDDDSDDAYFVVIDEEDRRPPPSPQPVP